MKLHLSEGLAIPPAAVTQTFAILGVRGSGKSNTAVVLAEEMFGAKLPFVVIDPVGTWWGLRSSKDGKGAGLAVPVFGGRHGDVPLEKTGGQLLADLVVDERLSCVLDVSEFSEGDKIRFLIDFAERLYRRNQDPLHLFLEEADDYCPQRPFREQARLLRAWENVVRRGRARGLGITMISQRSAALNKNVLTQIETLIVLRTTSPQDRKAIGAWVEYHGQSEELLESLPGLQDGEAWVWSPHWLTVLKRARIRRRETFDSAATPKQESGHRRAPATLADVDLKAIEKRMVATIERAKAEDPRELRRRVFDLEAKLRAMAAPAPTMQRVEIPILTKAQIARLEKRYERLLAEADRHGKAMSILWNHQAEEAQTLLNALRAVAGIPKPLASVSPITPQLRAIPIPSVSARTVLIREQQVRRPSGRPPAIMVSRRTEPREEVGPARQRILDALGFLESIGVVPADKIQLALMAGMSPTSGGYFNNLGSLRSGGLIDYPAPTRVALTAEGRSCANVQQAIATTRELHDLIRTKLPPVKWRLLDLLISAYPKPLAKDELAVRAGVSSTSGGYFNNLGSLRSLGLIEYPSPGQVVALPVLFLGER